MDLPPPTTYPFTTLPAELDVGTDPEDGWTQAVYSQHLLATFDPESGESTVRLHLVRDMHGRFDMDGGELLDGFERLQELGYGIVNRNWAPFSDTHSLEIVTLEGRQISRSDMGAAIVVAFEMSMDAINHRKLMSLNHGAKR